MENLELEDPNEDPNIDSILLPVETVCYLAKNYLPDEKDLLALALSGALSKDFLIYHGNNMR